jgi:uncharacterized PurR-regulated membrane protein YhhQ (DUF165 family)
MATLPPAALSGWGFSQPCFSMEWANWLSLCPQHHRGKTSIFGLVPRFAVASLIAYWMGEFTNSYTLAKLKILTKGRWLWTRTVGSTVTGQAVDTIIVILIAFWGSPSALIRSIIISSYLTKVAYEVLATPLTYAVVNFLKKKEGADAFDTHSNFNPFAINAAPVFVEGDVPQK